MRCDKCGTENDITRNFARCINCTDDLMVQGTIQNLPEESWSCDKLSEGWPCHLCGGALLELRMKSVAWDAGQSAVRLRCPKCGFEQVQINVGAGGSATASVSFPS